MWRLKYNYAVTTKQYTLTIACATHSNHTVDPPAVLLDRLVESRDVTEEMWEALIGWARDGADTQVSKNVGINTHSTHTHNILFTRGVRTAPCTHIVL